MAKAVEVMETKNVGAMEIKLNDVDEISGVVMEATEDVVVALKEE